MSRMLRGRAARAWSACTALSLLAVLVCSASALGADPPPLPKPDPPPKSNPVPPPPRPVVAPQPVAPVAVAPVVVQPTAAERRAAAVRQALAARRARARVARARARVARARSQRIAAKRRAAPNAPAVPRPELASPGGSSGTSALPFLLVACGAALALLGLALTPAWVVPWSHASRVLEEHRDELGVLGAMSLVATVVFFLLVQVTT
jgi:hypothetical protein